MTDEQTKMTRAEFLEKIEWEGGIQEAIDYGLRSDDTSDAETAAWWAEMERTHPITPTYGSPAWRAMNPLGEDGDEMEGPAGPG